MANSLASYMDYGVRIYQYTLDADGGGDAVKCAHLSDKSYAMTGTWDGATVVLQGSWDYATPATWLTLNESDNSTSISNTANAAGVVLENPIWIRPFMSGKGATTSLLVTLVTR